MIATLRTLDRALARVEEAALALAMLTLISVSVFQALKRHLFPSMVFWPDEVIRYSVFFVGVVGGALAAQSDRLINIDVMSRILKPRGKLIARIVTASFTALVCWLFVSGGLAMAPEIPERGELMHPATAILSLPIGIGLVGVHMVLHLISDAIHLATGRIPAELLSSAPPESPPQTR